METAFYIVPVLILGLFVLSSSVKILREYERAVVFPLGRLVTNKGHRPGIILLIPFVDTMAKVSFRTVAMDVAPQDVITRDNVSIKVNAVLFFRVIDPRQAVVQVEDYLYATSQISQTTLRSVLGQVELDDLLASRDQVNQQLQRIIDQHTDPWGVKVTAVEVKHVDLPQDMQRAMSKQAEAERERRAKIINAEGEFQAAEKLAQAANVLAQTPIAVQLRFLQTMRAGARADMVVSAAAIGLGALLLFGIQPVIAKRLLPWFGGSAAVWITCLVFFQSGLLAGYLYAHAVHRRLSPRAQGAVHVGALILSL